MVYLGGNPLTLMGKLAKPGIIAKNFAVIDSKMQTVRLYDFQGKIRVISSVPSVDTDVCAAQTRRFNLEASKLPDVQLISISCDLPYALKRFCATEGIENLITASDHLHTDFGIKYGFLIEELRLLARGIVVVDQKDIIRYVEVVREFSDHPDYNKALEVARGLR